MRRLLTGLALSLVLAAPQAYAGMISPAAPSDRERVLSLIERPEVAKQLEKMGIPADQAKARVAAMSEEEVASLAGKLDALPAGGALNNQDFLFIIIVILLVVILL
ncbi:MAG: PA2779 family protein [Betaproteobacteria bacterium]|nr:PA2779 family protein [Betaproteobacteria bacterium]